MSSGEKLTCGEILRTTWTPGFSPDVALHVNSEKFCEMIEHHSVCMQDAFGLVCVFMFMHDFC